MSENLQETPGENRGDGAEWEAEEQARLERRALRQRWPLTSEKRRELIERQIERALTAKKTREATQAFRAVLAAEQQNMEDEKRAEGGETINVRVSADESRAGLLATIAALRDRAGEGADTRLLAGEGAAAGTGVDAAQGSADGGLLQPGA